MCPPPFGLLSVSQEFCFYTMQSPRSPSVPCHWSQRAHSIERVGDNVILAYAANDCHSKVTVLPLKQVLSLLGLCPRGLSAASSPDTEEVQTFADLNTRIR